MTEYNRRLDDANTNLQTILNSATTTIDQQAQLIEEILVTLQGKTAGGSNCKYLWIKYDTETENNINILELKIDADVSAFPEDGPGDDGFNYKRIIHVIIGDSTNPAILEL